MKKLGIDISEWNTGLDYTTISRQIDFVILREGYRKSVDKLFTTHASAFKALKLPIIGVYHFIYALTKKDAKEEALSAIANVEKAGLPKTTTIWCDFEYDTVDNAGKKNVFLGPEECNLFTRTFCETVKAAGYPTGIYTNNDYYTYWYTKETLNMYDIWLADYSGEADHPCLMQQFTNKLRLNGYDSTFDGNYFFGNVAEDIDNDTSEKAIVWMEKLAKDDSHGYDQVYRWGEKGDYDCSSAVITAWEQAGVPVKQAGATYTGNMRNAFLKCGFKDVTKSVNLATGAGLKRGDVLLNTVHHTAMYCGDNKEVEASINEKGTAKGGKPGDQTGREILIRAYRNYPWNYVLRYALEEELSDGSSNDTTGGKYMFSVDTVKEGTKGNSVALAQRLLKQRGYKGKDNKVLAIDGEAGQNTVFAIKAFQKKANLNVDGICGQNTWKALLGL